jgi:hypothetical protein
MLDKNEAGQDVRLATLLFWLKHTVAPTREASLIQAKPNAEPTLLLTNTSIADHRKYRSMDISPCWSIEKLADSCRD